MVIRFFKINKNIPLKLYTLTLILNFTPSSLLPFHAKTNRKPAVLDRPIDFPSGEKKDLYQQYLKTVGIQKAQKN